MKIALQILLIEYMSLDVVILNMHFFNWYSIRPCFKQLVPINSSEKQWKIKLCIKSF